MKVYIGDKKRHLEIPEGWRLLKRDEFVLPTDMAANVIDIKWEQVTKEDLTLELLAPDKVPARYVGEFVIRQVV